MLQEPGKGGGRAPFLGLPQGIHRPCLVEAGDRAGRLGAGRETCPPDLGLPRGCALTNEETEAICGPQARSDTGLWNAEAPQPETQVWVHLSSWRCPGPEMPACLRGSWAEGLYLQWTHWWSLGWTQQRPPAGQQGRGLGQEDAFPKKGLGGAWKAGGLGASPCSPHSPLDEGFSCSQPWAHPSAPGASSLQAPQAASGVWMEAA